MFLKIGKQLKVTLFLIFFLSYGMVFGQGDGLSGDLIVFHAGSLSVPMAEISKAFKKQHPEVNILMEAAGSVACARKITELNKPCDVMASADYAVIDQLLIPRYAQWNIKFASNEMVVAFRGQSVDSKKISKDNWYQIMLDPSVQIGRADPNMDPCGYRSVLVAKLAEKYYQSPGLAQRILDKDKQNIRPKETDLLALVETGNVDYIFIYRSVAEQHHLKYVVLPDEINLKNPKFTDLYHEVSVEINGKTPHEKITQFGEPMIYGVTIPTNAPNKELAQAFVRFMLSQEGTDILESLGQPSVVPSPSDTYDFIPDELKPYATKPN